MSEPGTVRLLRASQEAQGDHDVHPHLWRCGCRKKHPDCHPCQYHQGFADGIDSLAVVEPTAMTNDYELIDWQAVNREQWSRSIRATLDEDGSEVTPISVAAPLLPAVENDEEPLLAPASGEPGVSVMAEHAPGLAEGRS